MGVSGLTSFIASRSNDYFERLQLENCYLVIDGNGIAIQMYRWHCTGYDCFGGDYNTYGKLVYTFFKNLQQCNVTPIILFDGGYQERKMKTIYRRMISRIQNAHILSPSTESSKSVFPMLIEGVFVEIALELGVKCMRADYEADSEIANIASTLDCPILAYDSDFYLFDSLYIPFSEFDMKVSKRKYNTFFIQCRVYKIENFLSSFRGLTKTNLPILGAVLGNDYIKKSVFAPFYSNLSRKGSHSDNPQQQNIKSVIAWLKNETYESAVTKILNRFKIDKRKIVLEKLNEAIKGYLVTESELFKYLNIKSTEKSVTSDKPTFNLNNLVLSDESGSEDYDTEDDTENLIKDEDSVDLPEIFSEKYRNGDYPGDFMNLIKSAFFARPQIEDPTKSHSHSVALHIVNCMHDIILNHPKKNLICVARNGEKNFKHYTIPKVSLQLPNFKQIQSLSQSKKKDVLFLILNMDFSELSFVETLPKQWRLFVLIILFWVNNSEENIGLDSVYSIILNALIINFVDKTRPKDFDNSKENSLETEHLLTPMENIEPNERIYILNSLKSYFLMDHKMIDNKKLYDKSTVHRYSEFQSCFWQIKSLNALLNYPFESPMISNFLNGTFTYNMTKNLKQRNNIDEYLSFILKESPTLLRQLITVVELLKPNLNKIRAITVKKRKKNKTKKSSTKNEYLEVPTCTSDDDDFCDVNNKFSLLRIQNI